MSNKTMNEKIEQGREYRNFINFEIRAKNEDENDDYIVEGYATTFNEPYVLYKRGKIELKEQVDARAFDNADMSDVIMQYNHEGRVFARNTNGTLKLKADEHGLKATAYLGGTEIGKQLYEEIKGGYTNKMSFGFTVAKDKYEDVENVDEDSYTSTRTILEVGKLFDVSCVSIPANDGTVISARNLGEGVIAEIEKELSLKAERKAHIEKIKELCEVR